MKKTKILTVAVLSLMVSGTLLTNVNAATFKNCDTPISGNNVKVFSNINDLQSYLKNFNNCYTNITIPQGNNCNQNTQSNNNVNNIFNPPVKETPETKPTESKEQGSENLSYAEQVAALVNKERAKYGLSALTVKANLQTAAQVRSKEIQTVFSHTRPSGSSYATALQEQNVSYRGAGENIAYGQTSPEAVMQVWMNSEGHRANILNANYTSIGVGYSQNANGTKYWTQLFTY